MVSLEEVPILIANAIHPPSNSSLHDSYVRAAHRINHEIYLKEQVVGGHLFARRTSGLKASGMFATPDLMFLYVEELAQYVEQFGLRVAISEKIGWPAPKRRRVKNSSDTSGCP